MKKLLILLLMLNLVACQKEEVVQAEEYLKLGFAQASYVEAADASSDVYGKMQVHTVIAFLAMNQDEEIVEVYFDEADNAMVFNNLGNIITTGRVEEWPNKKEADPDYVTLIEGLEENAKGLSIEDYYLKIEATFENESEAFIYKAALQNAYNELERVDGVEQYAIGMVNRQSYEEASIDQNGEIEVLTSYAFLALDENERVLKIELDEVLNMANFDVDGHLLTSRFDTRSKVEKKEDYGLRAFSKIHAEYFTQIENLQEDLLYKNIDEIEEVFKDEDLKTHCTINTSDLRYAILKAHINIKEFN